MAQADRILFQIQAEASGGADLQRLSGLVSHLNGELENTGQVTEGQRNQMIAARAEMQRLAASYAAGSDEARRLTQLANQLGTQVAAIDSQAVRELSHQLGSIDTQASGARQALEGIVASAQALQANFSEGSEEALRLARTIQQAEQGIRQIDGQGIDDLARRLNAVDRDAADTRQELERLVAAARHMQSGFAEGSDEAARLAQVIQRTEREISELGETTERAGQSTGRMHAITAGLSQGIQSSGLLGMFGSMTDGLGSVMGGMEGAAAAAGPLGIGVGLATAAIGASIGVINNATNEYAEFEYQLAKVSTLTDKTVPQLGEVADALKQMSRDTGASLEDLSNGMYDVLGAGVKGAEDMQASLKLVEIASKLAGAGFTETATATDVLTSVLNSYKMEAGDAQSVADKLFKTVDMGKISFEQLAGNLGMVTAVSSQAGISIDEVLAAIATMTANGVDASSSIDYLRGVISALLSPSEEAKKTMDKLGISYGDNALKTKGLTGVLEDLIKKTGGSTATLTELLGGVEATTAATSIASGNFDRMKESLAGVANAAGSAEEAYSKVASTAKKESERTAAAWKTLWITVGELFAPFKASFMKDVGDMLNSVNTLLEKFVKARTLSGASTRVSELEQNIKLTEQSSKTAQATLDNPTSSKAARYRAERQLEQNEAALTKMRAELQQARVELKDFQAQQRRDILENGKSYLMPGTQGPRYGGDLQPVSSGAVTGGDLATLLGMGGRKRGTEYGHTYGPNGSWGQHVGEDRFAPVGSAVYAPFTGTVKLRQDKAQGNIVDLFDANGARLSMIHLKGYAADLAAAVEKAGGSLKVAQGQILGYVGQTGTAAHADLGEKNAHLHYHAVVKGKIADVNKVKFVSQDDADAWTAAGTAKKPAASSAPDKSKDKDPLLNVTATQITQAQKLLDTLEKAKKAAQASPDNVALKQAYSQASQELERWTKKSEANAAALKAVQGTQAQSGEKAAGQYRASRTELVKYGADALRLHKALEQAQATGSSVAATEAQARVTAWMGESKAKKAVYEAEVAAYGVRKQTQQKETQESEAAAKARAGLARDIEKSVGQGRVEAARRGLAELKRLQSAELESAGEDAKKRAAIVQRTGPAILAAEASIARRVREQAVAEAQSWAAEQRKIAGADTKAIEAERRRRVSVAYRAEADAAKDAQAQQRAAQTGADRQAAAEDKSRAQTRLQNQRELADALARNDQATARNRLQRLKDQQAEELSLAGDDAKKKAAIIEQSGPAILAAEEKINKLVRQQAVSAAERKAKDAKGRPGADLAAIEATRRAEVQAAYTAEADENRKARVQQSRAEAEADKNAAAAAKARAKEQARIRAQVADETRQLTVSAASQQLASLQGLNKAELDTFKGTAAERLKIVERQARDEEAARIAVARATRDKELAENANNHFRDPNSKNRREADRQINGRFTDAEAEAGRVRAAAIQQAREGIQREGEAVTGLAAKYRQLTEALGKKADAGTLTAEDMAEYGKSLAGLWNEAGKAGIKLRPELKAAHTEAKAFGEAALGLSQQVAENHTMLETSAEEAAQFLQGIRDELKDLSNLGDDELLSLYSRAVATRDQDLIRETGRVVFDEIDRRKAAEDEYLRSLGIDTSQTLEWEGDGPGENIITATDALESQKGTVAGLLDTFIGLDAATLQNADSMQLYTDMLKNAAQSGGMTEEQASALTSTLDLLGQSTSLLPEDLDTFRASLRDAMSDGKLTAQELADLNTQLKLFGENASQSAGDFEQFADVVDGAGLNEVKLNPDGTPKPNAGKAQTDLADQQASLFDLYSRRMLEQTDWSEAQQAAWDGILKNAEENALVSASQLEKLRTLLGLVKPALSALDTELQGDMGKVLEQFVGLDSSANTYGDTLKTKLLPELERIRDLATDPALRAEAEAAITLLNDEVAATRQLAEAREQAKLDQLDRDKADGKLSGGEYIDQRESLLTAQENERFRLESEGKTGAALELLQVQHQARLTVITTDATRQRLDLTHQLADQNLASQRKAEADALEESHRLGLITEAEYQRQRQSQAEQGARDEFAQRVRGLKAGSPEYVATETALQVQLTAIANGGKADRQAGTLKELQERTAEARRTVEKSGGLLGHGDLQAALQTEKAYWVGIAATATKGSDLYKQAVEGMRAADDAMREARVGQIQALGQQAQAVIPVLTGAMQALGGVAEDEAAQWGESLGSMVGDVVNFATAIAKGDYIGAAIQALTSIFTYFAKEAAAARAELKKTADYNKQFKFSTDGYGTREVTTRVTGILFWAKTNYDEKIDEVGKDLALSIEGGITNGFQTGFQKALETGDVGEMEKAIYTGLKDVAMKSLLDGFLNSAVVAEKIGPLVKKLMEAFRSGNKDQITAALAEFKAGVADLRPEMDALVAAGKEVSEAFSLPGGSDLLKALGQQGQELELQYKKGLISGQEYNRQLYDLTLSRIEEERRVELAAAAGNAEKIKDINLRFDLERAEAVRKMGEQVAQDRLKLTQESLDLEGQALENQYEAGLMNTREYEAQKLDIALRRIEAERQAALAAAGLTAEEIARINAKFDLQVQSLKVKFDLRDSVPTLSQLKDRLYDAVKGGFEGGMKSALKDSIKKGDTAGLAKAIRESVGESVMDALITSFMQSSAIKGVLQPALEKLTASVGADGNASEAAWLQFDQTLSRLTPTIASFSTGLSRSLSRAGLMGAGATDGTITNVTAGSGAGGSSLNLTSGSSGGIETTSAVSQALSQLPGVAQMMAQAGQDMRTAAADILSGGRMILQGGGQRIIEAAESVRKQFGQHQYEPNT